MKVIQLNVFNLIMYYSIYYQMYCYYNVHAFTMHFNTLVYAISTGPLKNQALLDGLILQVHTSIKLLICVWFNESKLLVVYG